MGFSYRGVATLFRGTTGLSKVAGLTHTGFQASQLVCKVASLLPKVGPAFKAVYNMAKPLVKILKKAKDTLMKWAGILQTATFSMVKAVKAIAVGAPVAALLGMSVPAIRDNRAIKAMQSKISSVGSQVWKVVSKIKGIFDNIKRAMTPFDKAKPIFDTIKKIYTYKIKIPKSWSLPGCKSGYTTINVGILKRCFKCPRGSGTFDGIKMCHRSILKRRKVNGKHCCKFVKTKTCHKTVKVPNGTKWCHKTIRYPNGVKWCKKWGVPYTCGTK